jgi:hypothetical protein
MGEQISGDQATVSRAEALQQIGIAVERIAMLYYHFATTLVAELGEEQGRKLIRKAIDAYGQEVGEIQRQRVIEAGLEPTCQNFKAVVDLPRMAWLPENMPVHVANGKELRICPLAKYWIDKGAADLGRLYCYVDQAKYPAFDPESECRHMGNVLDGDDSCQVVAKKRTEWERIDQANHREP